MRQVEPLVGADGRAGLGKGAVVVLFNFHVVHGGIDVPGRKNLSNWRVFKTIVNRSCIFTGCNLQKQMTISRSPAKIPCFHCCLKFDE